MALGRYGELILLDTHVWLWSVFKSMRLYPRFADIIDRNSELLCVSVVSCWEIAMLVAKRRIDLGISAEEWFEKVIIKPNFQVLPLTPQIAADAYSLPGVFHDDPADRMIVATARKHNCLLLTEDSKILNYPHVRTE
jgi:PIN domain nuclease of toxin-antitoxin system